MQLGDWIMVGVVWVLLSVAAAALWSAWRTIGKRRIERGQ